MGEVGTFLYLIFGYKRKVGNRKQAYLIIGAWLILFEKTRILHAIDGVPNPFISSLSLLRAISGRNQEKQTLKKRGKINEKDRFN